MNRTTQFSSKTLAYIMGKDWVPTCGIYIFGYNVSWRYEAGELVMWGWDGASYDDIKLCKKSEYEKERNLLKLWF